MITQWKSTCDHPRTKSADIYLNHAYMDKWRHCNVNNIVRLGEKQYLGTVLTQNCKCNRTNQKGI